DQAQYLLFQDQIALMVDPDGHSIRDIINTEEKYSEWDTGLTTLEGGGRHLFLTAVVDAILAKKNTGTTKDMAPFVIALGPGFTAGEDCDVVIETMRGHSLARPITQGSALPNTGIPGMIAGHAQDRVLHSPADGILHAGVHIGDLVQEKQTICTVMPQDASEEIPVKAPFGGLVRGMIRDGFHVTKGFKIADVDPRQDEHENCFTISDKARAIGGAVVQELTGFAARRAVDEI
ncbi:MAG: EF2563 family selenium-dependent molybdenum hydroxylase system protein, partial [Lachnospiraceae bacterium]|nr:EF2563 family selenium-dependent molybdenum hydroxylase system protein [Lachnospiraceae bacterium]